MLREPLRREVQDDGRIRYWARITLPGETMERILRVVTLEAGETIHNSFLDGGNREGEK